MLTTSKARKMTALTGALCGMVLAGYSHGQSYPEKPISMVVSYEPGGATDFQARIATMRASEKEYLSQPVVVINKPGAGGKVGWDQFVTRTKPDGYELSVYNIPHLIAQSIVMKTRYNIDNIEPIANWGADPAVLIVNKDSPFNSVSDLVEYAKTNPGKVTFSGAGLYVGHHIALLQLEKESGTKLTYIPHQGGTPAMKSVMGGQVMAGFNNLSDAYRSRDEVKILAVADMERNQEFLPDVPTFIESGFNVDDSSVNFRGLMAVDNTPEPVLSYLSERVPLMFNDRETLDKMRAGGAPVRVMERDEVIAMFKKREAYLKELLAGLKG
ncbi:tripartite tricarboxylate transporter substrate binding protein [Zobellella maritima]|uniref:tripartite tricarboxylate transporter substrate binding protein n=1 Tax=Zobellella maritima TaxID=2059725 RepID=UPI0018E4F74E|nr:tripartite tricarboxylate transporter substrate binding protein [Zobellella maritima]